MLLAIVLATAVLAAGVPAAPAAFDLAPEAAEAAKKKKKKKKRAKKCRKGKVRVKIRGRRSCQSLRKALPRPRKGDKRIVYANAALGMNFSKFRDKRRRRGPSLQKVFRKQLGPKALPLLKRSLPRALAMLDGAAAARAAGRTKRGAHSSQFTPTPEGFSFTVGDLRLDVRLKLAGQLTAEFALTQARNGRRIRTTIRPFQDRGFNSPGCPDGQGVMDARDGVKIAITAEVLDIHDRVDMYFSESVVQTTTMHGQVADDAKLDYVDLSDRFGIEERVGGPGADFGPVSVRALIKRKTRINMRTGAYEPGQSSVTGDSSVSGLLRIFQSRFQAAALARLKAAADEGFSKTVDKAITDYRRSEAAWNTPDGCVKITFNPASNTTRLRTGRSGTVAATLGGQYASNAAGKWTLTGSSNGSFSPARGQGHQLSIGYTVGAAGQGTPISATYRVVGKSGVAQGTWTQPTVIVPTINTIAGTFNGSQSFGGSIQSWAGNVTYNRFVPAPYGGADGYYGASSGQYTVTASGLDGSGATACQQSGEKTFFITAGGGDAQVSGTPPQYLEPYTYAMNGFAPGPQSMEVTLSSCPPGAEEWEGDVVTIGVSATLDTGDQQSPNGIAYTGTRHEGFSGTTKDQSWSLTGSE